MTNLENLWNNFQRLVARESCVNEREVRQGKEEPRLHKNMLGSVESYKSQFIRANTPDKSTWID